MSIYDRTQRAFNQINRSIDKYQRLEGVTVAWYEFDLAGSTEDPLYDEGDRHYTGPKTLRVLGIRYTEAEEMPEPEGLHLMNRIHLSLSIKQVTADGLTDPLNTAKHVKDRFVWNSQNWDVRRYHVEERLREFTVTIGVDAVSLYADEDVNDPQFR